MIEGWPERIRAAQQELTFTIEGGECPRIPYGNEAGDWGAGDHPCHDCGVIKGELHVVGCDGERCPACAGQLLSCNCRDEDAGE